MTASGTKERVTDSIKLMQDASPSLVRVERIGPAPDAFDSLISRSCPCQCASPRQEATTD